MTAVRPRRAFPFVPAAPAAPALIFELSRLSCACSFVVTGPGPTAEGVACLTLHREHTLTVFVQSVKRTVRALPWRYLSFRTGYSAYGGAPRGHGYGAFI